MRIRNHSSFGQTLLETRRHMPRWALKREGSVTEIIQEMNIWAEEAAQNERIKAQLFAKIAVAMKTEKLSRNMESNANNPMKNEFHRSTLTSNQSNYS